LFSSISDVTTSTVFANAARGNGYWTGHATTWQEDDYLCVTASSTHDDTTNGAKICGDYAGGCNDTSTIDYIMGYFKVYVIEK
jgi:hypothetical protein